MLLVGEVILLLQFRLLDGEGCLELFHLVHCLSDLLQANVQVQLLLLQIMSLLIVKLHLCVCVCVCVFVCNVQ